MSTMSTTRRGFGDSLAPRGFGAVQESGQMGFTVKAPDWRTAKPAAAPQWRPSGPARGGTTYLGGVPTPGYTDARARGLQPVVGPVNFNQPASFGGGGRRGFGGRSSGGGSASGTVRGPDGNRYAIDPSTGAAYPVDTGRINAKPKLSRFQSRGLADWYAMQAEDESGNPIMPSQWQQLQNRFANYNSWLPQNQIPSQHPQSSRPFSTGVGTFYPDLLSGNVQAAAKGAPNAKSHKTYLVNEEGTEAFKPDGGPAVMIPGPMRLFQPPSDGEIIPHKKTMKMFGVEPRANGGRVTAPRSRPQQYMQTPMGTFGIGNQAANPYALKWAQGEMYKGVNPGTKPTYNELYEQGRQMGIDMSNAPRSLSGLQTYIRMGQERQGAYRAARSEVGRVKQEQQEERSQRIFNERAPTVFTQVAPDGSETTVLAMNPYGTGFGGTSPRDPGHVAAFYSDSGERFPWEAPWDGAQTTWKQNNLLESLRPNWEETQVLTLEELLGQ